MMASNAALMFAPRLQKMLLQACFSGDTQLIARGSWGEGYRRIDAITLDDEVLSRDENDVAGPLLWKRVEERFVRTGRIVHLHVGGQLIRTTPEHPFFAYNKGWLPASEVQPGDWLSSHDGQWVAVEEVYDTGEYETVYNWRVGDFHTYFVGGEEWGFSVWAHNRGCTPGEQLHQNEDQARKSLRNSMKKGSTPISKDEEGHHVVPHEHNDHELVNYAASHGWEANRGSSNGVALGNREAPVVQHNGSHPAYSQNVRNKLDIIVERNGGLNDAALREFLTYVEKMQAALPRLNKRLS